VDQRIATTKLEGAINALTQQIAAAATRTDLLYDAATKEASALRETVVELRSRVRDLEQRSTPKR